MGGNDYTAVAAVTEKTQRKCLQWFLERGGDAALAKTKAGGRYYLCAGETAPFNMRTVRALIESGKAEKYQIGKATRVRFFAQRTKGDAA